MENTLIVEKKVESSPKEEIEYPIVLNAMIEVKPRTWPGINKPGGIAKVTECYYKSDDKSVLSHVDVHYIVGRSREKMVPVEYITPAPQYDDAFQRRKNEGTDIVSDREPSRQYQRLQLRDRSALLGRCKLCGSLRSDCGSCDWIEEERQQRLQSSENNAPTSDLIYDDSSSDQSDIGRIHTERRRGRRMQIESSSSDQDISEESSDESNDDEPLSNIYSFASKKFISARKTAQKLANAEKMKSRRHQHMKRDKRRKLKTKYKASDKQFKERLQFLNTLLSSSKESSRVNSSIRTSSVLESIGDEEHTDTHSFQRNTVRPSKKRRTNVSNETPQSDDDDLQGETLSVTTHEETNAESTLENRTIGYVYDEEIGEKEVEENGEDDDENNVKRNSSLNMLPRTTEQMQKESLRARIQGYYNSDSQLDDFIQPEGSADYLPSDLVDRSAEVHFDDLPDFVNELQQELINSKLPDARQVVDKLKKSFEDANTSNSSAKLLELENECRIQYEYLCSILVRDGTDQCRTALKRFSKRREFRMTSSKLSKRDWIELNERLDMKFDDVDKEVEALLRELRNILDECAYINGYNSESSHESEESAGSTVMNYPIYDSGVDDDVEDSRMSIKSPKNDRHKYASTVRHKTSDAFKPSKRRVSSTKRRNKVNRQKHRTRQQDNVTSFQDRQYKNSFAIKGQSSKSIDHTRTDVAQRRSVGNSTGSQRPITNNGSTSSEKVTPKVHAVTGDFEQEKYDYDHSSSDTQEVVTSLSLDNLLQELSKEQKHFHRHSNDVHENLSVFEACDQISSSFPCDSCLPILESLPSLYSNPHLGVNKRHVAVTVLETLLRVIIMHRDFSLQDILQNRPNLFVPQVTLLKTILHLLFDGIGEILSSSDGLIFKIFHSPEPFLNIVTNQIIDILYSQYRREVWGSGRLLSFKQYGALCQLRQQLGKGTHCIEIFSSCLMTFFEVQCWYKSRIESKDQKWFVSSINPNSLNTFWNGDTSEEVRSRLSYYKKMCPREEIDAIWKMFLWFGAEPSNINANTSYRWRLLVTLFSYQTGVFGPNLKPVSANHPNFLHVKPEMVMKSCEELISLRALLSSGSLDPLPSEDTIISRFFHLSTLLTSRVSERDLLLKSGSIFSDLSKQDAKLAYKSWEQSDSFFGVDSSVIFHRLLKEMYELPNTEASIFALSPNLSIARAALSLVTTWVSRLPDKKARWSRFFDSVCATSAKILQDAEFVREENIKFASQSDLSEEIDPFSASFSNIQTPLILEKDYYYPVTTACEFSAHLMICVDKLRECHVWDGDKPSTKLLSLDFLKKIWNLLSSDSMKRCLENSTTTPFVTHVPMKPIFIIMKVFSSVLYHNLEMLMEKDDSNTILNDGKNGADTLKFILSCMVTCFKSILYNIRFSQGNTKMHTSHFFWNQSANTRTQTCLFNILSCGLLWQTCLVNRITLYMRESRHGLNWIVDNVHSLSPEFLALSSSFISEITNSKLELKTIDASFRLCLAFTQSLMKFDFMRTYYHRHRILSRPSESTLASIENDSTFHISSDNGDQSQESVRNQLWDLLILTIQKSKPSERYAIERDTTAACFSHQGRTLVARHVYGSCSALVNICICSSAGKLHAKTFLERLRQMDVTSSISDGEFFSTIQECFCAKLVVTMKALESYNINLKLSSDDALHYYLRSCLSASTMNYFPTSDFDTLKRVGDESSKQREYAVLMTALSKLEDLNDSIKYGHSDRDTVGLKLRSDYFDSPRTYLVSHFWRWTQQLSYLLGECNDDLDTCVQEVCTNILNGMSRVSIEKECLKRAMMLRSVMSKYIQRCNLNIHRETSLFPMAFASIVITFISEIKAISRGVSYYEQSNRPDELYQKSKAFVLQKSFITMYTCFFSWLLGEVALYGSELTDYSSFIFRYIITPALNGNGIDQSQEIVDSLRRLINSDVVQLERLSPLGDLNQTLKSNLQIHAFKHIRTSIMYATHCSHVSNPGTIFYSLMNIIFSTPESNKNMSLGPVINPELDPHSADKLESSLILYFSVVSMVREEFMMSARNATKAFREYAIRNFIVPKVRHPTVNSQSKVKLLMMLLDMLKTIDVKVILTDISMLDQSQVMNSDHAPTFDFRYDICAILDAIYLCMKKEKTNTCTSLINASYDVLETILRLKIVIRENEEPLVRWSVRNESSSTLVQYFNLHWQIFVNIATLWSDSYQSKYQSIWEDLSNPDVQVTHEVHALKTCIASKEKLDELYFPSHALDSTQNAYRSNTVSQKNNMSTSATTDKSISEELKSQLKKFLKVYAHHHLEE